MLICILNPTGDEKKIAKASPLPFWLSEITIFFSNVFKAEKKEDHALKERYVEKKRSSWSKEWKDGQGWKEGT